MDEVTKFIESAKRKNTSERLIDKFVNRQGEEPPSLVDISTHMKHIK